jgi:hypothetical protein
MAVLKLAYAPLLEFELPDDDGDYICSECEREIKKGREVWLELNGRTGELATEGQGHEWSDGPDSQGWFPFGADCAKRLLKKGRW